MTNEKQQQSRRDIVRLGVGLATGAALGLTSATAPAPALAAAAPPSPDPRPRLSPDEMLNQMMEGNRRFVLGQARQPRRTPKDFQAVSESQAPRAVVITCADSRVTPEILFDQGIGDIFVIRVAGNVISGAGSVVKGSIEFAVAELGASLVMVLGHSNCGAVKAAIAGADNIDILPGSINELADSIKPAVTLAKLRPGDLLENAIQANVMRGVRRLEYLDPIVAPAVKAGKVKVVGAVYGLKTGEVKLVDAA